jgi:MSHA biogenesis protein MshQ
LLLLGSGGAHAAIQKQQTVLFPVQGAGTTTSASFATTPSRGNVVVVSVWAWAGNQLPGPDIISVSDTCGNVYSTLPQVALGPVPGANGYQDGALLSAVITNACSPFIMTARTARTGIGSAWNGLSQVEATAVEYSGLAGLDQQRTVTGTTPTATISLGGPTTSPNQLVSALVSILWPAVNFGSFTTTGTGTWTQLGFFPNNNGFPAGQSSDQVIATQGTTPTITWTATSNSMSAWAAAIVAFRPDSGCISASPGGSWNTPATWISCDGGIPAAGSSATIAAGAPVTIDAPVVNAIGRIIVQAGSTLNATAAGTITLGGSAGSAGIINDGTLDLSAANVTLGNSLSLGGGGSFTLGNMSLGTHALSAVGVTSAVTVKGNLTGTGSFSPGASPWTFSGSAAQTIPGTGGVTFGSLTINNASGVTTTGNVTVSTALTLSSGRLITGGNTLFYSPSCKTSPISFVAGSSYIDGNLSLAFPSSNNSVVCTFPLGDSVGYAPITTDFNKVDVNLGTLVGTSRVDTGNTQLTSAGFNPAASVARYWRLTKGTLTLENKLDVTLQWNNPGDMGSAATFSAFDVKYLENGAGSWTTQAVSGGNITATTIKVRNLDQGDFGNFGTFVVGSGVIVVSPASGFNVVDGNYAAASYDASATHNIYTKLAGWNETTLASGNTTFTLDVIALNSGGTTLPNYVLTGATKLVTLDIFDDSANSPSCMSSVAACTACPAASKVNSSAISVTFAPADAGYKNDVSVTLPNTNAYSKLIARVTDTTSSPTVTACSTDVFTVRPRLLTVTAANAAGTAMVSSSAGASATTVQKAGNPFTINAASNTANYTGTPAINLANVSDFLGSPTAVASLLTGSFNAAAPATGQASGSFTYGEVGYLNLGANAVVDSSFAAGSGDIASGDCVNGSTSNSKSSGKYGCSTGSAATSWGRFIPHRFGVTGASLVNRSALASPTCTSTFTYMGEEFKTTFTLVAQNASGGTTYNYASSYAKLDLSLQSSFGFARSAGELLTQGPTGAPSAPGVWGTLGTTSGGQAVVTAYHQIARSTSAAAAPMVGASLTATPVDLDLVTGVLPLGTSNFYYGKLQLTSYAGAAAAQLKLPLQALYWSGSSWIKNTADSCTPITAASVALSNYRDSKGAVTGAWTTTATGATLNAGQGFLTLTPPSPANTGSVSVAINLGSGSTDAACLTSRPTTTGAGLSYLRGKNGACLASTSLAADPSGVATFGVYTPESTKTIHIREVY